MSCLPGNPCYTSTINTIGGIPGGCNLDPCNITRLGSDAVFYIGPNLPCSGINPCDNVSLALQKMDAIICNPPSLSITANNGLTKTVNNIQLGGPLIQQTVITTSFSNTLSLIGLASDSNPAFILSQTSPGVIKKTTIASILSGITANNGLTITSGLIQLSGPLIKPTTVTADATNTLTLAGLQADANPDFVVTETTAGVVRRIATSALGTIIGSSVTANNGLLKTGSNIQLGGALVIANTDIVTNGATNTLSITGLSTDATPDFILTETTAGIVKKIATSALSTSINAVITANNGVTKTANNIQLGGALVTPTTVTTGVTNTLTLAGLVTNNTPTNVLVTNGSNVVQQITYNTLLTNISNNTLGNLTANNGITKTVGDVIELGGTLNRITAINLFDYPLIFQNKTTDPLSSEFTFTKSVAVLDTFDRILSNPSGSKSRLISFRSSAAMWTTNYQYNGVANPAYNAFAYWLSNVKPWIPAEYPSGYPAGVSFQILENFLGTNRDSAIHGHYFDERVSNSAWGDTWSGPSVLNKYSTTFPGWTVGKTYTLRTLIPGDVFPAGMSSLTRSGTPSTSGWTFVSTGTGPTIWTNGSIVEGDFPITELDPKTSYISTKEEDNPLDPFYQKGIVRIESNATYISGYVDQGSSPRGLRLAIIDAGDPLPTSAVVGEMFYRVDDASIVFKVDNTPTWKKVNTTTTT